MYVCVVILRCVLTTWVLGQTPAFCFVTPYFYFCSFELIFQLSFAVLCMHTSAIFSFQKLFCITVYFGLVLLLPYYYCHSLNVIWLVYVVLSYVLSCDVNFVTNTVCILNTSLEFYSCCILHWLNVNPFFFF